MGNSKNLKDRYYDFVLSKIKVTKAEEIAFSILDNIGNRKGLHWTEYDEDVCEELIQSQIDIVENLLKDKK